MKTAIAYTSDIILGRTGDVISRESQKDLIKKYAARKDIEVVAWYEDEMYNEDIMSRSGVKGLLDHKGDYDMILVERVWSLSRVWPALQRFFEVLDRKGIRLESATTMWDCVSQMARRRFDKKLVTPKLAPKKVVVFQKEGTPHKIRKPKRLHFVFQPGFLSVK